MLAGRAAAHARSRRSGPRGLAAGPGCGRRARTSRPPRLLHRRSRRPRLPREPGRRVRAAGQTAGRWARTSRPPRWPTGCRRRECSGSSLGRKASRISSVSDGRPTAPRPRHGAGETWTYRLFPDCGDREATLPVGLPPPRRIRKVSLDSSLSGRPELHCEAQLSAPAPRSLQSDRTPGLSAACPVRVKPAMSGIAMIALRLACRCWARGASADNGAGREFRKAARWLADCWRGVRC